MARALDAAGVAYFSGEAWQAHCRASLAPRTTRCCASSSLVPERRERLAEQWGDVVEVLRVSGPEIDEAYLDRWAISLTLTELLAGARAEARAPRKPVL